MTPWCSCALQTITRVLSRAAKQPWEGHIQPWDPEATAWCVLGPSEPCQPLSPLFQPNAHSVAAFSGFFSKMKGRERQGGKGQDNDRDLLLQTNHQFATQPIKRGQTRLGDPGNPDPSRPFSTFLVTAASAPAAPAVIKSGLQGRRRCSSRGGICLGLEEEHTGLMRNALSKAGDGRAAAACEARLSSAPARAPWAGCGRRHPAEPLPTACSHPDPFSSLPRGICSGTSERSWSIPVGCCSPSPAGGNGQELG